MFIIYDIIFLIVAVAYLPYLALKRKWHAGLWTRFGFTLKKDGGDRKTVWVHAVSVGEVLLALNLIEKIRERFPGHRIVLSTVTVTGHALACQRLQDSCLVIYAPFDFSWVVRKYVSVLNPAFYISVETEIWPNLFACLQDRNVPIIEVNGRISDTAFVGYRRISFLIRGVLRGVRVFCMQTEADARRIIQLGADPRKVRVVGNLKFDSLRPERSFRKEDIGFQSDDQLLIAGSTYPGEDEIVMDVYQSLTTEFPRLRLVIVPRHVERADEIARSCQFKGLTPRKLSQNSPGAPLDAAAVVIVDRIGYLRGLYSLADVAFVGKSLRGNGGQNMIEPLFLGRPTIVGPHTQNFRDIVRIFMPTGALIVVKTLEEFVGKLRDLLNDPAHCTKLGLAAQKEIARHQGATEKTLMAIEEILGA